MTSTSDNTTWRFNEQTEDPSTRRAGWSHDWQSRWSHELGRKPLSTVPCSWQATFNKAIFDQVYRTFETEVLCDVRTLKTVLPICGIDSGEWLAKDFDDEITFRRMEDDEIGAGIKAGAIPFEAWSADSFHVKPSNQWALVAIRDLPITYSAPGDGESPNWSAFQPPELRRRADSIAMALRLVSGGSIVVTRQVTSIPMTGVDLSGSSLDERWVPFSPPNESRPCVLNEDDKDRFWSTFSLLPGATESHTVALRRVVLASQRISPEDALVDLCIALEAVFGPKDARSELNLRISLNAAFTARAIGLNAKSVFDFVQGIYRLRGLIVHGSPKGHNAKKLVDLEGEPSDIAGLVDELDGFLRSVLEQSLADSSLLDHVKHPSMLLSE